MTANSVVLADPEDKSQIGASIPGLVSKINIKPGDKVKENQVLAVIEAMKMENLRGCQNGWAKSTRCSSRRGSNVKAGELLITMK